MLSSLREKKGKIRMLSSPMKNGLDSLFEEVRVFTVKTETHDDVHTSCDSFPSFFCAIDELHLRRSAEAPTIKRKGGVAIENMFDNAEGCRPSPFWGFPQVGVNGDAFSLKAPKECSEKFASTFKGKFLTRGSVLRIFILFLEDFGAPL